MNLFGTGVSTNAMKTGNTNTGIGDLTIGFSRQGMNEYKESLKIDLLEKSIEKINNTDAMMSAIDAGWQGIARDKFVEDFNQIRQKIANELLQEYNDLNNRLEELANNYLNQDRELYEKL